MSFLKIILCILFTGYLWAQDNLISIAYHDLADIVKQSSPQSKVIYARQDLTKAMGNLALQWSNPEFNIEYENVEFESDKVVEQVYFMSKTFDMPWNYWKEKNIWKSEMEAAGMERRQSINDLIVFARNGYVRLYLLTQLNKDISSLKQLFDELYQTVNTRQQEGALSRMEARLIGLSLLAVDADLNQIQLEYRNSLNQWMRMLGIDPDQKIQLTTTVPFKALKFNGMDKKNLLAAHPGLQAREMKLSALDQQVTLEKMRIMPSITLAGGYKKANSDWEGYVIGLSLPLPLLNWNGAQVEEKKINQNLQIIENNMYKQELRANLQNVLKTIESGSSLLQKHQIKPEYRLVEDLLTAYHEGMLSLTDFLNAVQIYRDGSIKYVEQLAAYYRAVFELEALVGQQLVNF